MGDSLKLFISYSHLDEAYIKDFIKHITPLKTNGLIKEWYDRKIVAGMEFQDDINNNLDDADIICLFTSANFLSSDACLKEKKRAMCLKRQKGTAVIPIILSPCGWLDDKDLSVIQALPADGKPVTDFGDLNKSMHVIYEGLKNVMGKEISIKQLKNTDHFSTFLQNIALLTRAHSQKEEVTLDDIFIYPELNKYNDLREYETKESSSKLIEEFFDSSKLLIAGENQSGKTTLCKKMYAQLRRLGFVPIYVSGENNFYRGKMSNIIEKAYGEQYAVMPMCEIEKHRIVPVLDDFHLAKNKEKCVRELSDYKYQIVIVDDVFSLNFKDEQLISSFTHFKIIEMSPLLRSQLIAKWVNLSDKKNISGTSGNEIYKKIDSTIELVEAALGKIVGAGVMPAYPFFILSILSTYETVGKPLDQEITSQGYCYQALIYLYLRKQRVANEEIDTYINFLTEFAFFFYKSKKNEISNEEFNSFMQEYLDKYNFPVPEEKLLKNLKKTQIIALDSCNNYSFYYPYLYYFFVAKYLAEHIEDNKKTLDSIINNLHKDENAYIAIFISHHTKNTYVLEELLLNAYTLFDKFKPATLSKIELSFFDEQATSVAEAALPPTSSSPEKERAKRLALQGEVERGKENGQLDETDEENNDLAMALRRSIKTVEVMGAIVKNRAGSLEKAKLEEIFAEAMKVHLRVLSSFFDVIKRAEQQQNAVDFISARLNKFIENKAAEAKAAGKKAKQISKEELTKMSKKIFWSSNFFVIYGVVSKIVHSLGSNKLSEIVAKICDAENSPATYLVKHGILMWYQKNLQVDNIVEKFRESAFSETAKKVMKYMIVNHCELHDIDYKCRQKIESKLGIPSTKLLPVAKGPTKNAATHAVSPL
jgi:hypothetical protein